MPKLDLAWRSHRAGLSTAVVTFESVARSLQSTPLVRLGSDSPDHFRDATSSTRPISGVCVAGATRRTQPFVEEQTVGTNKLQTVVPPIRRLGSVPIHLNGTGTVASMDRLGESSKCQQSQASQKVGRPKMETRMLHSAQCGTAGVSCLPHLWGNKWFDAF